MLIKFTSQYFVDFTGVATTNKYTLLHFMILCIRQRLVGRQLIFNKTFAVYPEEVIRLCKTVFEELLNITIFVDYQFR